MSFNKKNINKTTKKDTKSTPKKKKNLFLRILGIFLITFLIIGVIGFAIGSAYVAAVLKSSPPLDVNKITSLAETSIIFDKDGNEMDMAPNIENRQVLKYDEMNPFIIDAIVAIEDERFYSHNGIDIKRIFGSALFDLKNLAKGEKNIHGASTLTQQVLKMTTLDLNQSAINRKLQEIYLAMELEKKLDKNTILEVYLNSIPLGNNAYGVEVGALRYFGKPLSELNLIQCAYLAGLPQAPSDYNAFSNNNPDETYIPRTKQVLGNMLKIGKIDEATYNDALNEFSPAKFEFAPEPNYAGVEKLNFEYFTRPVLKQVQADLQKKYNLTEEEAYNMAYNQGLQIYSTMDRNLQTETVNILNNSANWNGMTTSFENTNIEQDGSTYSYPSVQASSTVIDYRTGNIVAMVGGIGDQPSNSMNRAYSDDFLKPMGSTVKPLSAYAPAIDTGTLSAGSVLDDTPVFENNPGAYKTGPDGGAYLPSNYTKGQYLGYLTLREGLMRSQNTIALKALDLVGFDASNKYLDSFGIKVADESDKSSLAALALGQFSGSNTKSVAAAYGVFGNGGLYTDPNLYTEVKNSAGEVILDRKTPSTHSVISPQAAYIMFDMLKDVVNGSAGTGGNAAIPNFTTVGKTGTTEDNKQLWFSGLTSYYSCAVWVGTDTNNYVLKGGSSQCASIFKKIMTVAHTGLQNKPLDKPSGISNISTCIDSGYSPNEFCSQDPRGNRIRSDFVIDGKGSNKKCDIHVSVPINIVTGKVANDNTPQALRKNKVFIIRKYNPGVNTSDSQYVLPSDTDDFNLSNVIPGYTGDYKIDVDESGNVTFTPITPESQQPQIDNGLSNSNSNNSNNQNNTQNNNHPSVIN